MSGSSFSFSFFAYAFGTVDLMEERFDHAREKSVAQDHRKARQCRPGSLPNQMNLGRELMEANLQNRFVLSRDGDGGSAKAREKVGENVEAGEDDFFVGVADPIEQARDHAVGDAVPHRSRHGLDKSPQTDGVNIAKVGLTRIQDLVRQGIRNLENLVLLDGGEQHAESLDGDCLDIVGVVVKKAEDSCANGLFVGCPDEHALVLPVGLSLEEFAKIGCRHVALIFVVVFRLLQKSFDAVCD